MPKREYNRDQLSIFPIDIPDVLGPGHPAKVICAVLDRLHTDYLYESVSDEGAPCYDPKMMAELLIYGYSVGITSSRKIAQALKENFAFSYIAAMQQPDFRTINRFRRKNRDMLEQLFAELVIYCAKLGMVSMEHIAIDGTKVHSSGSDDATYNMERLKKRIRRLLEEAERIDIEEDKKYGEDDDGMGTPAEKEAREKLLKELDKMGDIKRLIEENDGKKVNATDPEANFMRMRGKGIKTCYNVQAAVDGKRQIIVACKVTNSPTDENLLVPMIKEVKANTGKIPRVLTADAGYGTGHNYRFMNKAKIDGYVPLIGVSDNQKEEYPFGNDAFIYNAGEDVVICPCGEKLEFISSTKRPNKQGRTRVYRGTNCNVCADFGECTTREKGRIVKISNYREDRLAMKEKLMTDYGKEIYRKRAATVEPVFGNIKWNGYLERFSLGGVKGAEIEFYLAAIAHNIKKIGVLVNKRRKNNATMLVNIMRLFLPDLIPTPYSYVNR